MASELFSVSSQAAVLIINTLKFTALLDNFRLREHFLDYIILLRQHRTNPRRLLSLLLFVMLSKNSPVADFSVCVVLFYIEGALKKTRDFYLGGHRNGT